MTRAERKRATERRFRRVVSERRIVCRDMARLCGERDLHDSAAQWRALAREWRSGMALAQLWGQR